jgi:hypothetical protein
VIEAVREAEVRRQLGAWVLEQHPAEPLRRTAGLATQQRLERIVELYGLELQRVEALLTGLL